MCLQILTFIHSIGVKTECVVYGHATYGMHNPMRCVPPLHLMASYSAQSRVTGSYPHCQYLLPPPSIQCAPGVAQER